MPITHDYNCFAFGLHKRIALTEYRLQGGVGSKGSDKRTKTLLSIFSQPQRTTTFYLYTKRTLLLAQSI